MTITSHTYILQQAIWEANGKYYDTNGDESAMKGIIKISHMSACWHCDELLKIPGRNLEFFHSSEISPLKKGDSNFTWQGFSEKFGTITGRCVIVDDVLISTFKSISSLLNGVEYARFIDKFTYELKGHIFDKNNLKYSWILNLNRKL